MSIKKKLGVSAAFLGASLALAKPVYSQQPVTPAPIFYDSLHGRSNTPVSGMYANPFGWYCPTQRNVPCVKPVSTDTTRTKTDSSRANRGHPQRNGAPISTYDLDLTAAGNGAFVSDFIYNFDTSEGNGELPFDRMFYSNLPIKVSFEDARTSLEARIRNMGPESSLTGEKRAFRNYLRTILDNTSRNDQESLRILNQSAADLVISHDEIYHNGQLAIKPDLYVATISNGRSSLSMILYIDKSGNRRLAQTELPLEQLGEEHGPGVNADTSSRQSIRIPENLSVTGRAGTPHEFVPPTGKRRNTLEAGLEAEYATDGEATIGGFANVRVLPGIRAEAYADYSVSAGKSYSTGTSTDTTQRETELIGPGTYKTRTDMVTTSGREESGRFEFGGRLVAEPFSWLDLAFGVGDKTIRRIQNLEETSSIDFTRNDLPLGNPQIISNSLQNTTSVSEMSLGAGARVNLGRFGIQGSYNRERKQDRWKIGARYTF